MAYNEKPQIKLYAYRNNSFELQAIIDDYMECSFERNLYQAGTFTISINYNIPNAQLFQRGLFVQFGNDPYDFGEIIKITDAIGSDGKASQLRTITGYDARYILKRRVIKNMNANGTWQMTGKGETCLRNLVKDQCGAGAEEKRRLPIANTIPATENAIGKIYSVSESFSNLYEVCKTIATQSEIGWRMNFNGSTLTLEVYEGTDRSDTVQFSTSFDSLADGNFTDSAESFSNAIYVGGKGQNDDRDIYEGEDGTPEGLERFECWDNQSSMTTESEYEAEALSMLTQYGQTVEVSGNGLAKSPYEYKEQYDVGDLITLAFSGKSAVVQILSVVERWAFGNYTINFSFGKPQNTLSDQLQLMLRKIQEASNKTKSTDSVRWYTIPTDSEMPKADVTYDTIGFIGTVGTNATFKLYLDSERTGAKSYHVWIKQLGGTGKLTLTTGVSGAVNLTLGVGTYVAIISVDENGNIINVAETPTDTNQTGNTQPATSSGVAGAISDEASARDTAITNAINALDVSEVGGSGKFIQAISEVDGKISATAQEFSDMNVPSDSVVHYSFDDLPDMPDGTANMRTEGFTSIGNWSGAGDMTLSIYDNGLKIQSDGTRDAVLATNSIFTYSNLRGKVVKVKFKASFSVREVNFQTQIYPWRLYSINKCSQNGNEYIYAGIIPSDIDNANSYIVFRAPEASSNNYVILEQVYIGDGSYTTPVINNSWNGNHATNNGAIAVQGLSGKGAYFLSGKYADLGTNFNLTPNFTVSLWINTENNTAGFYEDIFSKPGQIIFRNGASWGNYLMLYLYGENNTLLNGVNLNNALLPPNQWNHIVVSRNALICNVYINSVKIRNYTLADGTIKSNNNSFGVGGTVGSPNTRFHTLDDFLIFNRALTDNEVMALYQNRANTPKFFPYLTNEIKQGSLGLATSGGVFNAIRSLLKTKEVTGTTSANGYISLGLAGLTNVVVSIQTANSNGFNNDMLAIPYKLGDGQPSASPTGDGRWGAHVTDSLSSGTAITNTTVYLKVFYFEL